MGLCLQLKIRLHYVLMHDYHHQTDSSKSKCRSDRETEDRKSKTLFLFLFSFWTPCSKMVTESCLCFLLGNRKVFYFRNVFSPPNGFQNVFLLDSWHQIFDFSVFGVEKFWWGIPEKNPMEKALFSRGSFWVLPRAEIKNPIFLWSYNSVSARDLMSK